MNSFLCGKARQALLGLVICVAVNQGVYSFSFPANVHKMKILDLDFKQVSTKAQVSQSQSQNQARNHWLSRHKLFEYLRKIESARTTLKVSSSPNSLNSFKWEACDHSLSLLNMTDLSVSPDPLHFPGNVFLHFAGTLKETIDAPLQLKVILKKEITAAFWLEVPCINGIGSCTYDDLCETLQGATCPNPFVKYNVPCKCPFNKGSYKMLKSAFNVDVGDVPAGNYYLEANTSYGTRHLSCIRIHFSIRE